MPELPEVEIVKQSLNKKIKLKKIRRVIIRNRNLRFKIPSEFERKLHKKVIKNVSRFSKYLLINFTDNTFCIIHLGMTGTIHLVEKNNKKKYTNTSFYKSQILPRKHNHIEIHFDRLKIIYNDPRRFGFFKLVKNNNELSKIFKNFGPEPFSKSFNLKYIRNYLKDKNKNIKNFLIDQKFVSGIGNIYASEILYLCKIKPLKKGKKISIEESKKIVYFSKYVLKKSIQKGGSTIRDFKNVSGYMGEFQKEFRVYQRENLKCYSKNCMGIIIKKNISNRSTFFCSACQK
tara:strand:- start:1263 stop:2126 length:864 start_codon:yes stop_codon:yes gene_type:complete